MRKILSVLPCCFALFAAIAILPQTSYAQSSNAQRRITQAVDDKQLTLLKGNTHPYARPRFDQGAAPATLPLERMMLVLRRSPEQEAALDKLMAEQLDPASPNFHHWLTPEEFGLRFGPGDQDIQTVTSWLGSHGFQVLSVAPGRIVIEFSGNAGEVKEAFHTEIHKYLVNGEEHWANSSDPQIPSALVPVVVGVNTLHNFPRHPASQRMGLFQRAKETGQVTAVKSDFTFNQGSTCTLGGTNNCFAVGPADFATIYNVQALWTAGIDGTGQTIAVVGDSNINPNDPHNFRALFGLPVNDPTVIFASGSDPGLNGDELEATLDVQWSGAVAKGAAIKLVIAANTAAQSGVDIAANFVIQHSTAPVLAESFGLCELFLGTTTNQMFNSMWQQAATDGITVVVSTGDTGAASCENPTPGANVQQPATTGLAVSGIASTPFNVAVGGTDFNQLNNQSTFWNSNNVPLTQASARGYIPETTWNDSCTNQTFITAGFGTTILNNCNNTTNLISFVAPLGGGGGISNCTTPSGMMPSNCSGGNSKPTWQNGITPADGKRHVPDVSLFSGDGLLGSFYPVCQQDNDLDHSNTACDLNSPFMHFIGVGGTSVSTQSFAGIVALINQKKNAAQGLINPRLYQLAAQANATCTSAANPAANCIFYDVVTGTISGPCVLKSPNCGQAITAQVTGPVMRIFNTTGIKVALAGIVMAGLLLVGLKGRRREWNAAFAVVILGFLIVCAACGSGGNGTSTGGGGSNNGVLSGFNAAAGYDRATGLGTVNAANLVNNW
jgi:subtilase family serine protease